MLIHIKHVHHRDKDTQDFQHKDGENFTASAEFTRTTKSLRIRPGKCLTLLLKSHTTQKLTKRSDF